MTNPVTLSELDIDNLAWSLAQSIADALPPYLEDNDLTVDRFYERNKERISKTEARELLERLVEDGKMDKQERRNKGHGGSHVMAYVVKA